MHVRASFEWTETHKASSMTAFVNVPKNARSDDEYLFAWSWSRKWAQSPNPKKLSTASRLQLPPHLYCRRMLRGAAVFNGCVGAV